MNMTKSKKQHQVTDDKPLPKWHNRIVGHGEVDPGATVWPIRKTGVSIQRTNKMHLLEYSTRSGWVQSVIVNKRTGFVLDGHLRVALAITAGERVPVVFVDLSEEEESLILATLDPLAAMAVTDEDLLAGLVGTLEVGDAAVQALLDELAGNKPRVGLTDEDAIPELADVVTSRPGDLWLLGDPCVCPHCGSEN